MNLYQLKVFHEAAKQRSFSAAAQTLFITQPAVTKQIQQFEATHGIKLFNRFGKRMVLTDAGEMLFEIAERIFQIENQAEEKIRDVQQRKSGHIRIHSSESFGAYYLPSILYPFKTQHPQILVSVNIFTPEEVIENTIKVENDLGFISSPVSHEKLVVREILEDRVVLIVPSDHFLSNEKPHDPMRLHGQPMIMHEKGSATRNLVESLARRHNIKFSTALELSNNEAIKRAVEQGIGLALISERVVRQEVQGGTLKTIYLKDPYLKRKFYMIHHKDKYLSHFLKEFVDIANQWSREFAGSYLENSIAQRA
jgi:DNA-binding transcriptional LysR family regulator